MAGRGPYLGWPMPPRPFRLLIAGFFAVVLCFFSSTLYSQHQARSLDEAALTIATNDMPSVERLAAARTDLRHTDLLLHRYVVHPDPQLLVELQAARARTESAVGTYLELPAEAEEREHFANLHRALSRVDGRVSEVIADVDSGNREAAHQASEEVLRIEINAALQQLDSLIEYNANDALQQAERIGRLRARADRMALILDGLSALFTILLALLGMRAVRAYSRALEDRNRLTGERAQELEQFAGRVAHDILGPLSAARMALSLGIERTDEDSLRRNFERGQRSVSRVSTIVDALLKFARAGAKPDPGVRTPVAPVVDEIMQELSPLASKEAIELAVHPVPSVVVPCSPGILTSLLENLLRNAIKYMADRPVRTVSLRISDLGRRIRCEIEDSGPGIAPELQRNIFDPYVRGRNHTQPGIGLGLATVKRIALAHGGTVGVSSIPEVGSRFWFELPKVIEDYQERSEPARSPSLH